MKRKIIFSFRSSTLISISSPSSTSAIGPPSTASGLQCPITGPVDAPEINLVVLSVNITPPKGSRFYAYKT